MTEPETETDSGPPSAAIETIQLVASAAEETETAEGGGGEELEGHQQQEEKEEEEREEEEKEEEENEEEYKEEEQKEEEQQEEEEPEEPEEEEEALVPKEEQEQFTGPSEFIAQVGEPKEDQAENFSSNNKEAPIPKRVVNDGGKKEDENTRQDNNKKVDEKKIEVTEVEAKKETEEPKVLKLDDKNVAVVRTVGGLPAAEGHQYEMRDRMEDVEEEEEEEVEEEEEEEEVLEEKEEEEEEEEEEQEEEEEEEPEQQLQLQQVISKEEKMVEEEEEEDEEDDAGEEDELNERDGSPEEQVAFTRALKAFFKERRMDYKAPKFYGEELNILKLWRAVTSLGGYEQVTAGKLWRKVGEQFQPPKTCTTLSWSFRGFYEKALLEYERYQAGVSYPASSQPDGTISGTDSQAAMSPNTPSSQPSSTPASGSGRMRRDAATRAMHGWHAQRLGNGEVGDPGVKVTDIFDRERLVPSKKEKQLKNLVGSKRKETGSLVERAVKVARAKGSKGARSLSLDEVPTGKAAVPVPNKSGISKKGPKPERTKHVSKVNSMEPMRGLKLVITDDGPPADWVKINAYRTSEGYEIYALVPGLAREEVRIQCEEGGRVVICGSPEQPNNPWGVTAFRKVVNLPSKIDAHHTSAVVTLYGQLFVRVPFAHAFQ